MKNRQNWFSRSWKRQDGLLGCALVSVNLSRDQWREEGWTVLVGERGKDWAMLKLDASEIDRYVFN